MTLHDYAVRYCRENLDISTDGAEQLRISVRLLDRSLGRTVTLQELSRELVCEWLRSRLDAGLSRHTVKRNRANVRLLWARAAEDGLAPPLPRIPPVTLPRPVPRAISVESLTKILAACDRQRGLIRGTFIRSGLWWRSLCLVLFDVGSRLGATLALQWSDLDLERRTIVLRDSEAKTRRGQVLDFSQQTGDWLNILKHDGGGLPHVFPWPYAERRLWVVFKRLLRDAGLPAEDGLAFHALRRSCATYTVEATSLEEARQRLGHTSVEMTARYVDPRLLSSSRRIADLLPRP